MVDKPKFRLNDAKLVAGLIRIVLGQYCERCEVAGSIRRGKPEVSDCELLYIPRFQDRPDGLLLTQRVNLADECLDAMLKAGELAMRPSIAGVTAWGPKNKLGVHVETGIPADFFATTEANWWVSLVIRTGSKDTNLELTTSAQRLGRSLLAYGSGVKKLATGEILEAHSEEEVFQLCGVPYKPPEAR